MHRLPLNLSSAVSALSEYSKRKIILWSPCLLYSTLDIVYSSLLNKMYIFDSLKVCCFPLY